MAPKTIKTLMKDLRQERLNVYRYENYWRNTP